LGLVRHAGDVERTWLRRRSGRQDLPPLYADAGRTRRGVRRHQARRAEADFAQLPAEWGAADEAVAPCDVDATCDSPTWGELSLRWVCLRMIREYAGHCGQADLIPERIGGRSHF
jgi:hypothetical protein